MVFAKLFPFLLCFGFGFFVAMTLYSRRRVESDGDWEGKYRSLEERYRDVTRRLQEFDQDADYRANRLRRTLWDVRGILSRSHDVSEERIRVVLEEIEAALNETGPAEEAEPQS